MSLLSKVTTEGRPMPPRIVLYAAEKFGKSSFGAYAWNPIFLMTAAETGLLSLIESGRIPQTAHFPEDFKSWSELQRALWAIRDDPHNYRTLVIDTGNGAEQLCTSAVCEESCNGDWKDYASYGRGNELATKEWAKFLRLLDEIRMSRRMAVLILQHAKVKAFQDPAGKDWDQWRPEGVDKLWALTHKWADCILFGGFKVQVKNDKATSESRFLRAEASGAIVAGNRYGLPAEITAPPGAEHLWKAFSDALAKVKGSPKKPVQAEESKPVAVPSEAPTASPATLEDADNERAELEIRLGNAASAIGINTPKMIVRVWGKAGQLHVKDYPSTGNMSLEVLRKITEAAEADAEELAGARV